MKTYSPDLRERVVDAVRDSPLSQAEIAKVFSVSLGTVENWWRSWRATRRTEPLPHAGGMPRTLQPYAAQIQQAVQQQPDATLEELCATVEATTHQHATASMMCRELHHLNLPQKKVTARQSARYPACATLTPNLSKKDSSPTPSPRRPSEIHR